MSMSDLTTAIISRVPMADIEARVAQAEPVDWRGALRALALLLPLMLGFMVGRARLGARYVVGAFVAGMNRGLTSKAAPAARETG